MARPKKATVDYFPHVCQHGQTMFVLEQRYGNDGYAFWFKLLETLGATEGHALDLNGEAAWEFLQAKTRLDGVSCTGILDLLAKLGSIDPDLWVERVVWSQHFVDGIAPVYANRRVETPTRPSFYRQKPQPAGVSSGINPQSRVEESRVEKSSSPPPSPSPRNPDATQTEREVLKALSTIPGWPLDWGIDLAHIRQLAVDYPAVDLLTEAKKLGDYLKDKPLKRKSNPRLRFRNWCEKAQGWAKPKSAAPKPKPYTPSPYTEEDRLAAPEGIAAVKASLRGPQP